MWSHSVFDILASCVGCTCVFLNDLAVWYFVCFFYEHLFWLSTVFFFNFDFKWLPIDKGLLRWLSVLFLSGSLPRTELLHCRLERGQRC